MTKLDSPRFGNFQNWYDYVTKHTDPQSGEIKINGNDLLSLRNRCYKDIEKLRGRPLFVYASNFLTNLPPDAPISINLSDIDGFTDLIKSVDNDVRAVDIMLHSPGGSPDATERIVKLLRNRFDEVHFIIPHSAYSAATMMAMSGNTITLHSTAVLGPIDPQINNIPARQIKRAFTNIQQKVLEEGQESIVVYLPLIQKYDLHLLEICDDAEKLSKKLVKLWIREHMLHKLDKRKRAHIARKATDYMADFDTHLIHSRPLDSKQLEKYGLPLTYAESTFEDLMREAHILLKATFDGLGFIKLYESPERLSWGTNVQIQRQ